MVFEHIHNNLFEAFVLCFRYIEFSVTTLVRFLGSGGAMLSLILRFFFVLVSWPLDLCMIMMVSVDMLYCLS